MDYSYNYAQRPNDGADSYSALSIIGLVCSFLFVALGLILSVAAHSDAEKTGSYKSQNMAKAGIIVGTVRLALFTLAVAALLILLIVLVAVSGHLEFIY